MAKWVVSCSQHVVLVIWIEFPPKLYRVTLLFARKVKLPKCQQIPIISAGGKKQFCCCPWWMWLKKKITNLTCSNGWPRQEKLFQKLFTLQNGKFCFTGNSQLSHLFRLATPSLPGSASWSVTTETKINKQKCLRKMLTQQPKQENGHLPP